MDYTQLTTVLLWLVGNGSPAVITYVLSWVVENWSGWAKLPQQVKFLSPLVASVLLAIGANELLKHADIIVTIQPWFQIVMASAIAYLSSQKAYVSAKNSSYGARFGKGG